MDLENHLGIGFGQQLSNQNLDELMKSYMDQCIQYDEEQRALAASSAVHESAAPHFVSASVNNGIQNEDQFHQKETENLQLMDAKQEEQLRLGIERAQAIAAKFSNSSSSRITRNPHQDDTSYPYAQRRYQFSQKFHRKLQDALLKNLTYLADRDEDHLQRIEQVKQHVLKKDVIHSLSGIGSKERKYVQKEMIRKGHDVSSNLTDCGVYVTGLSLDDESEVEETNTLSTLFSSYGKISKIKIYHDKATQKKKGDGLVLYDWPSVRKDRILRGICHEEDDPSKFLTLVCGQVSNLKYPFQIVYIVRRYWFSIVEWQRYTHTFIYLFFWIGIFSPI